MAGTAEGALRRWNEKLKRERKELQLEIRHLRHELKHLRKENEDLKSGQYVQDLKDAIADHVAQNELMQRRLAAAMGTVRFLRGGVA